MIEVEVVKIDIKSCQCVGIKKMTINEWLTLKKQIGFRYYAFQLGFHSYKIKDND